MWPDNETGTDFLNFSGVAETVGEIVVQARGRPISIGVSGAWGAGKSSMIKLIRHGLENRPEGQAGNFVFVEFNAWLYQGYDDARAALLEVIASTLAHEAQERKTGVDKAHELLGRVNWLRAAKLTASSALALSLGLPPVGLIGEAYQLGNQMLTGEGDQETIAAAGKTAEKVGKETAGLFKPKPDASPPKQIHAIRECFEETLSAIGVTLVVLIDDLDRCLPPTTISTLEANLSLLMRKLIGAGTPREAVAGGYGCICVLIAPAGAVLVAQMVLIVSEDGETAFVALCFAVE